MTTAAVLELADLPRARPFLKWAGGKTQLVPEILARVPPRFDRYLEPFLGGGAVFFALSPGRALLSDKNAELIGTYTAIRDQLPAVMAALRRHEASEAHFYEVREQDPSALSAAAAAARFIFLNRTCFNGLYRVNKSGRFNVPFGRYKNPRLCDEDNLTQVAAYLRGCELAVRDVFVACSRARRGDLVYLDPPYDPLSPTASFTSYTAGRFGREEQERLALEVHRLAEAGVHVRVSNSDTPFIRSLYRGLRLEQVWARRAINSRADRRGVVAEVLIGND